MARLPTALGMPALWLLLLAFDTGVQLSFKLGAGGLADRPLGLGWLAAALSSRYVLTGLGCYVGAFLSWLLILRHNDLSRAFPLSAAGYLAIMLASRLFLGEPIGLDRWAGAGFILLGIAILGSET